MVWWVLIPALVYMLAIFPIVKVTTWRLNRNRPPARSFKVERLGVGDWPREDK